MGFSSSQLTLAGLNALPDSNYNSTTELLKLVGALNPGGNDGKAVGVDAGEAVFIGVANDTTGGLVGTSYQNFPGAKTCRNDDPGSVKGAGMYNADTTNNNSITFNWEFDTTGAGAQTQRGVTYLGTTIKDHNDATLTADVNWSTTVNGTGKTIWGYDSSTNALYTDATLSVNGDFQVNNGYIRTGRQLDVLTGQGFDQSGNGLSAYVVVPATGPVTGTNIFANGCIALIQWSEDMDAGVVPFLGVTNVAAVGQIAGLVAGKTMTTVNEFVAGSSDGGSVAGAVLTNYNMYTAGGLLGGTPMTITTQRMFYAPAGVGGVAATEFGLCVESAAFDNYIEKSLAIGGGADDPLQQKITVANTALEIRAGKDVVFADQASAVYLGPVDTEGTWRYVVSGTDLLFQRYESGVYVTKSAIGA